MSTFWRMERKLLECTLTQVWSRAAICPLCISLYFNDVDEIAEGVQGAVTGTTGSAVRHMLYADDLTLMASDPDAMQTMLNRLHWYAQRKHLLINTAKSQLVHFNYSGSNVFVFNVGRFLFAQKDNVKYLGAIFHRCMSMIKTSKQPRSWSFYGICFSGLLVCTWELSGGKSVCVSVAWEGVCAPSRYVCWPGVGHWVY